MSDPKFGQIVYDKRDGNVSWTVVGVDEQHVSLSGPGPCRGMKEVALDEFVEWWEGEHD